ncbi:MAG: glycosyltransferase family 2 protein [Bacteroidetes bacterium]|nr:glycosyltransferase family 2 protein [Bacteroidota bacterium]
MPGKVLIVIPCYNEEASLPSLLPELLSTTLPNGYQLEAVIINDCSKDNTSAVAKKHNATVIDLPVNLGIGGAVQTGIRYALDNDFDMAIQLDGDGQHPPGELPKLINHHLQTGANIVIGSRFIEKKGFQSSFARRMGIKYFHWLNRLMTGLSIYDSTSGFRLFDRKAIALASANYPDEYPEPESLVVFSKAGLKISEVAVVMAARQGGQSSIRSFGSLYYCFKVSLAMFFSFIRKP